MQERFHKAADLASTGSTNQFPEPRTGSWNHKQALEPQASFGEQRRSCVCVFVVEIMKHVYPTKILHFDALGTPIAANPIEVPQIRSCFC